MSNLPSFEDAIDLLQNAVKYSTIDNQKHIDLSVVVSSQRETYQKALMVVQSAVARGEVTQKEVNEKLGII